jgi:hypothetical protein
MAKKQVEVLDEVPSVESDVKAPEYSPAQLYKQAQLKAAADKREKKRSEVLAKIKDMEDKQELGIRGRWIVYTEKNGVNSPAIIVSEKFKDEDDSLVIGAFVYSPNSAQPYRVEITF